MFMFIISGEYYYYWYLPAALPAFKVLRPHIVVIDLVDDRAHSFVKSTRGQLAPVTTRLTTQEQKSNYAARHPQEETVVEEHVGCGWRLAVDEGRLRGGATTSEVGSSTCDYL